MFHSLNQIHAVRTLPREAHINLNNLVIWMHDLQKYLAKKSDRWLTFSFNNSSSCSLRRVLASSSVAPTSMMSGSICCIRTRIQSWLCKWKYSEMQRLNTSFKWQKLYFTNANINSRRFYHRHRFIWIHLWEYFSRLINLCA